MKVLANNMKLILFELLNFILKTHMIYKYVLKSKN